MKDSFKNLNAVFKLLSAVKLVYLFGSRAVGKAGPLSDYDFAFYLDEPSKQKRFKIRLTLFDELSKRLKTDRIDVIILNDVESPELKYSIISTGRLLYEKGPYKVIAEPVGSPPTHQKIPPG